jgi:hypothetical protein
VATFADDSIVASTWERTSFALRAITKMIMDIALGSVGDSEAQPMMIREGHRVTNSCGLSEGRMKRRGKRHRVW